MPAYSASFSTSSPHTLAFDTTNSLCTLIMSHGKQFTLYTHKGGPNGW